MAPDDRLTDPQFGTQRPDLVLVKHFQRFDDQAGGPFRFDQRGPDVVVALDDLGLFADTLAALDQVGVEGALGQEIVVEVKFGDLFFLDPEKGVTDGLPLGLGF